MAEEIKEILARLKAIEEGIVKLGEQDLSLAKEIVCALAPMEMNIAARTMEDEELKAFIETFSKKEEEAKKELESAKTIESAISVLRNFDAEIANYVQATKVDTAEKAMEIAHSFIKKYNAVALPLKAMREDDTWLVDIDVGALAVKVAKVKIDARTGDIVSYEIPQKASKEN